jgi:hypothetical protein
MMEASRQPKDKNYNPIAVLYQPSNNVESLKTHVQDAEFEDDQEGAGRDHRGYPGEQPGGHPEGQEDARRPAPERARVGAG